jgi:hypothetical protein
MQPYSKRTLRLDRSSINHSWHDYYLLADFYNLLAGNNCMLIRQLLRIKQLPGSDKRIQLEGGLCSAAVGGMAMTVPS